MNARQVRFSQSPYGTFGVFSMPGLFLTTLEPAKPIPAGHYTVKYLNHPQHGWCWEITNVPGYKGILYHVGNYPMDTDGCTCLGLAWGRYTPAPGQNEPYIISSRYAVNQFTAMLKGQTSFELNIVDSF